ARQNPAREQGQRHTGYPTAVQVSTLVQHRAWSIIPCTAMYKPPERIRHPLGPLRAPSAAEAAASRLVSPIALPSGLRLAERTWVPSMVPWRAIQQGEVTPEVLDWYRRFAAGRPGALVVEATGIRDLPSGPLLRIGDDRFVPGLARLVDTVRRSSGGRTRLFIQLIDFLRI